MVLENVTNTIGVGRCAGTARGKDLAFGGRAPSEPRTPRSECRSLARSLSAGRVGPAQASGRSHSESRPRRGTAPLPPSSWTSEGPDGDKAAWANALWDQQSRQESLCAKLAEARDRLRASRRRKADLLGRAGACASEVEVGAAKHDASLAELRGRRGAASRDLEVARAEAEPESRKGRLLRAGIQAKERELERDRRRVAELQGRKEAVLAKAEAKKEYVFALAEAEACAEAELEERAELPQRSVVLARQLHNAYLSLKGNIRVFCRVRPRLPGEVDEACVTIGGDSQLTLHSEVQKSVTGLTEHSSSWDFGFDHVFAPEASQDRVFEEISLLVQSALDGYKVAIFAYGQTGGGKTYTMEGPPGRSAGAADAEAGIIPRTVDLVFEEVQKLQQQGWDFEVSATILEIYNDSVRDVLASGAPAAAQGEARASAMEPQHTARRVESPAAVKALLRRAVRERHVEATACNDRSSRSHAIVQLAVSGRERNGARELRGLLSLVDLAGSERVERSGATGERLKEAQYINRSLSALGDVIEALARRKQKGCAENHVPYRNSQLTKLLKDSLGGESKALMFVNISPCLRHCTETLSSLRFASKVHACHVGGARRQVTEAPAAKLAAGGGWGR